DTVLLAGIAGFAVALGAATLGQATVAVFTVLGLVAGLAAGPIMSLAAEALTPGNRARGMGLFFTLFYILVVAAPVVAGRIAESAGTASAAFLLGSAMLVACVPLLAIFRAQARLAANRG